MKNIIFILVLLLLNNKLCSQPLNTNFNNVDSSIKIIEVPHYSNTSEIMIINDIDTSKIKIVELEANEIGKIKRFTYQAKTSIDLTSEMKKYLNSVSLYMKKNINSIIIIDGHSFNNNLEENEFIANERANRVLKYLISKSIERNRIFAKGNGDKKPLADNTTEIGQIQNNRIEIIVRQK